MENLGFETDKGEQIDASPPYDPHDDLPNYLHPDGRIIPTFALTR